MTYIQKDIEGFYFESDKELYSLHTYEDFLNGAPIKLYDWQIQYHKDYPEADIQTILNVVGYEDGVVKWCIEPKDPITEAKDQKLAQIYQYDSSDAINDVIINNTVHGWVDAEQRANYRSSLDAAKRMGLTQVSFFVDNNLFTVSVEQAEDLLAAIQIYADQCFIVTKQHEIDVQSLSTIEEVEAYDYTAGYPAKLNFTI